MTEKEYYLWSNKFNNWCIHASAAAFLYKNLYCLFRFEFSNSKQIMKCKLQMKTNENEIDIWGV